MLSLQSRLLLAAVLVLSLLRTTEASKAIPGTTNTLSGYDTELGVDPVCWRSQSYNRDDSGRIGGGLEFPSDLIEDYMLGGTVQLMESCPSQLNMTVQLPLEFQNNNATDGFRPRTNIYYDFTLQTTIDMTSLNAKYFVSDFGPRVVVQIVLCRLGSVGFCSPFVHEQANVREANEALAAGIEPDNTNNEPGYVHGGTHVHSEKVFVDLPENQDGQHSFAVQIPFIVSEPGDFFVVGGMQFFLGNKTTVDENAALMRYDVANAASPEERIVTIQEPANIPRVDRALEIAVYVFIALACGIIFFLMEESIRHRNNQIMKLSQGHFLTVLLAAALFSTACAFLMNPTVNDLYCKLSPPLIFIPIQLIYAIMLGRVWRTQQVLSPLLQEIYETKWSRFFSNCIASLACSSTHLKRRNIRATVTNRQLATVVFIFTLPQVILQVLAWILQPRSIEVYFNEDASRGRMRCVNEGGAPFLGLVDWGFYLVIGMNLLVLIVAQSSKRLPSLFNELSMIGAMSFTNVLVWLLGFSIIVVTIGPETSPNVSFLIWIMVVLSITLNSSIRLMVPKLKMVWRGETVLVSKLVADHRRAENDKKKRRQQRQNTTSSATPNSSRLSASWRGKLLHNVKGLSVRQRGSSSHVTAPSSDMPTPSSIEQSLMFSSGMPSGHSGATSGHEAEDVDDSLFKDESGNSLLNDSSMPDVEAHEASMSDILATTDDGLDGCMLDNSMAVIQYEEKQTVKLRPGMPDDGLSRMEIIDERSSAESAGVPRRGGAVAKSTTSLILPPSPKAAPTKTRSDTDVVANTRPRPRRGRTHRVLICDTETPSRTLVVPMVKLQEKLLAINGKVTTGLGVSHSEWEELRTMTIKLGDKFQSDVSFEWEDPSTDF